MNLVQVRVGVAVAHLHTGSRAIGAVGCPVEASIKYRPGFTFSL